MDSKDLTWQLLAFTIYAWDDSLLGRILKDNKQLKVYIERVKSFTATVPWIPKGWLWDSNDILKLKQLHLCALNPVIMYCSKCPDLRVLNICHCPLTSPGRHLPLLLIQWSRSSVDKVSAEIQYLNSTHFIHPAKDLISRRCNKKIYT